MRKLLLLIFLLISGKVYSQNEIYGYYENDQYKMSQRNCNNFLFVRTDHLGNVVWLKTLHDLNSNDETTMNQMVDKFIVAGRTKISENKITSNPYDYEYWFVRKQDTISNYNVFPNPTKEGTILFTDLNLTENVLTMNIVDVSYRVLSTERIVQNQHQIDLSGFRSGIYFIQLITDKQNKLIKIIKI